MKHIILFVNPIYFFRYSFVFPVPSVVVGLEQSNFTVVGGRVINVCVYAMNNRYDKVVVVVYLHIEGNLKNKNMYV